MSVAPLTLYFLDTTAPGSNFRTLQVGGSVPGAATGTTGFTVGTTTAGLFSSLQGGVKRSASTFQATTTLDGSGPQNSLGDGWRTDQKLTGWFFANTTWDLVFRLIASQSGNQDVRVRFRLWRSPSPLGVGAVEITPGAIQVCSTVTNLSTSRQSSSLAPALAEFGMVDEYLFVETELEIVGVGASSLDDVLFCVGSDARIVTPNFDVATVGAGGKYHYVLSGVGLLIDAQGSQRNSSAPFVSQLGSSGTQLRDSVPREQVDWSGGSQNDIFGTDAASQKTYAQGLGIDPHRIPGSLTAGPAIITSLAAGPSEIDGFTAYSSLLHAGFGDGTVRRQNSLDSWSAALFTVTGGPPLAGIASGNPIGVAGSNGNYLMAIPRQDGNGKIIRWDGSSVNQNIGDANSTSSADRAKRFTHALEIPGSPVTVFVLAVMNSDSKLAIARLNYGGAWYGTYTVPHSGGSGGVDTYKRDWYMDYLSLYNSGGAAPPNLLSRPFGSMDPIWLGSLYGYKIRFNGGAGSTYLVDYGISICVANVASNLGEIYAASASGSTSGIATTRLASLTGHYPTCAAYIPAIISGGPTGTIYYATSIGELHKIDEDNSVVDSPIIDVLLKTNISFGQKPEYMIAYLGALWIGFRINGKYCFRRYGRKDATDPASEMVLSEPIYGGAIDQAAGSIKTLGTFGTSFYIGGAQGGALDITRVDHSVYNSTPVALQSAKYSQNQAGVSSIFRALTVQHSALLSGDVLSFRYSVDGGPWKSLGSNSTVGATSTRLNFSSDATGLSIQIEATIDNASSAASIRIDSWLLDTKPSGDTLREWSLRVVAVGTTATPQKDRNEGVIPWTGDELSYLLWTLKKTSPRHRLMDADGRAYEVSFDLISDAMAAERVAGLESPLKVLPTLKIKESA